MVFTSSTNGSPAFGKNDVDAAVNIQAERTKRTQRQFLNLLRLVWIDLRRANMLGAAASLRIEKRILVGEVVKAALWNYFENRQGLITENTYRQLAARHKFFYQQFAIVLCRLPSSPNQVRSRFLQCTRQR